MRDAESLTREIGRLHFQKMHESVSKFGLGKGQPPILKFLSENDGCKQTEIAKREHISAATTTVMLQTMEKNGLVERKTDDNDLRIMRVYITPKGLQMQKKCDEVIDELDRAMYVDFSEDELTEFKRLLAKKRDRLKKLLETEEN